jgi:glycosyltransferase involved in cell wall biosynthesis
MKVLYISYWSINDPLTISSVMPTLPLLREHLRLERLTLVTIERQNANYPKYNIPYDFVDHVAISPKAQGNFLATKAYEMLLMPRQIGKICKANNIDLVYARCSLAGTIAYKINARLNIPFIVDSFEPHSDYMANCGAWEKDSWKYRYARKFEKLQMHQAKQLITVTANYRDYLASEEGVNPDKIAVIPCVTDLEQTKFKAELRERIRTKLNLGDSTTAIYLGKFGDLYYDDEAFKILKDGFEFFDDFRVILLTPTPKEHIQKQLRSYEIPEDRVYITSVPRSEVPSYLSAADFGYSFVRPHAASLFQCPIKHGEYWACGLPFITPDKIADDYRIIEREGGGSILAHDLSNLRATHEKISEIISNPNYRAEIRKLAVKYKSAAIADEVFSKIF